MAVSRTTARVDSELAVHILDRAILQWPFLLSRPSHRSGFVGPGHQARAVR